MKLGFDLDGCLAQFNVAFAERLVQVTGKNLFPADYDRGNPPVWEWPTYFGYTPEEEKRTWESVWSEWFFWQHLNVEPGQEKTLERIARLSDIDGHEIYFITNRRGRAVQSQCACWLLNNGINTASVIIARDKLPIIRALALDAFIDDKIETANDLARAADERDIPTRVYLKETLHNRENRHPALRCVPSVWDMLVSEGLAR